MKPVLLLSTFPPKLGTPVITPTDGKILSPSPPLFCPVDDTSSVYRHLEQFWEAELNVHIQAAELRVPVYVHVQVWLQCQPCYRPGAFQHASWNYIN